jgi:hypothetical protein
MTEAEWLECDNPLPMLIFLRRKASQRKFRLYAVGCCRPILQLMPDECCRQAVAIAERFADGMATAQALREAAEAAFESSEENSVATGRRSFAEEQGIYFAARAASYAAHPTAAEAARCAARTLYLAVVGVAGDLVTGMAARQAASAAVRHYRIRLIHDVFGNPFRPVKLDPAWLTRQVKRLAQAIYDDHRFEDMPVLGDALEEAGCTDEDLLNHCRQPGEHVRGCWVVDLVLGKS